MVDFQLSVQGIKKAFPRFSSIESLPEGGQKLVFRVVDTEGQLYALKFIKQDKGPQDERALREIKIAGELIAPWFVKMYEAQYCQIDGVNCISILEEFIPGKSLATVLAEQGAQSHAFVRNAGNILLSALSQIEEANLVHRDIKPSNIIVSVDGRIVLIDFGIARHLGEHSITQSYALFGPMTIGYCAPEQIRNEKRQISIRTDLFAFGIVLYEMTTGKNPFCDGCSSPQQIIERCLRFVPPPLSNLGHPKGLSDFVEMCMAKASHRRPPSADKARQSFTSIRWED